MAGLKEPSSPSSLNDDNDECDGSSLHCDHCDFRTDNQSDIVQHMQTCHDTEDESQVEAASLRKTYVAFTGGGVLTVSGSDDVSGICSSGGGFPVYRCGECEYETFSLATLSSHRKTHSSAKKLFQCDVCHMKFSQAANMRRHKMRHTGIKPFECRVCLKRFFRKDHLMEHMVTHSKQLPFQCPTCGKNFHRQVHLKEHLSSEHSGSTGIIDRVCSVCGYRAATAKGAKLHYTTRHARHITKNGNDSNQADNVNNSNSNDDSRGSSTTNHNTSKAVSPSPVPILPSITGEARESPSEAHVTSQTTESNLPPLQPNSSVTLLSPRQAAYVNHTQRATPTSLYGYVPAAERSLAPSGVAYPGMVSFVMDDIHKMSLPHTASLSASTPPTQVLQLSSYADRVGCDRMCCLQSPHLSGKPVPSSSCDTPVTASSTVVCVGSIKQELPEDPDDEEEDRTSSLSGEFDAAPNHCPSASSPDLCNTSHPTTPDSSRPLVAPPARVGSSSNSCNNDGVDTRARRSSLSDESASSVSVATDLRCRHCGIIFPDQTLYFLHKGLHSEGNPWKCNICGETCHDKYDFNAHILSKAHQ